MNLRVNQLQQPTQLEPKAPVTESDGSFRFTLLSSIEEQELRASLAVMMEDITQQGNKLSRKMDIRDMKLYRKMIKEFMNEIVHTPIPSAARTFSIRKDGTECTAW